MEGTNSPKDVAVTLQIIFLITILSIAPAILILTTSFTRIIIVFSFLRSAMGTQAAPPNQVLVGLALFLTFFIMSPVFSDMNKNGLAPYLDGKLTFTDALNEAKKPLRKFMLQNTRKKDILVFLEISKTPTPKTVDDIPDLVLLPAFVTSEIQTAFEIGFLLFLPFLIIDFVVSSVLLSMGMMMLPPVMISMPFKILLFVLVDGWNLVVTSLVKSYM
ncbi:MAG: flagellar type III secretion system pore protein FliP [Calditerrivibrio sp.]|nr:flagellar type III secretion system pore protein FliP [Calditerrivibrio sp.]MCA1933593.1 flagellar type III secretion system pore protein FliP [Calditerrivibrio sp.]MCA1980870.1 flagellar type III secretion system pore protein FliP [Calditerrivibrio sp.]